MNNKIFSSGDISWDWSDEAMNVQQQAEEQRFLQELAVQNAAYGQAQAGMHSQQLSNQQQTASISNGTVTGQTINGYAYGSIISASDFYGIPEQRRPDTAVGEDFLDGLHQFFPKFVKEIVVQETLYEQLLTIMSMTGKKEYEMEFTYHNPWGKILIKNEKFQFNLDKYVEEGPAVEI